MPNTTGRKPAAKREPDAIALLKADHSEVSALLGRYEKAKSRMAKDAKEALANKICDSLSIHAKIEEEIFYPACKEALKSADDLLAEAGVEHQSLKELIQKIRSETPGSEKYDAEVKVLGEYVKHHVKEEQSELFPKARKSSMDLAEIGRRLRARKEALTNETSRAAA